jgi:hypothetical protein
VRTENTVAKDTAEATRCLVDPFDLVSEVPEVGLEPASRSSEQIGSPLVRGTGASASMMTTKAKDHQPG